MSGFVGILNLDKAPIPTPLLHFLTRFQEVRGPDAQQVWLDGYVGFGHTLLRTTDDSEHERQPLRLAGDVWIVADARVDRRGELIAQLRAEGHQDLARDATDTELILRSYQVWGEHCILHLLGDFTFAVWDKPRQLLFCARDHMGVKPFYYASVDSTIVFSNSLDCVRLHPAVSDELNDRAIADFLLFGHNQDPATTSFADIQRIPPAHWAGWSAGGVRVKRYWTMPIDEPIFYKRSEDYCDRFKELLREAVGDRLRTPRVGVFMSGGLDSPALAATAHDVLRERYSNFDVIAVTDIDDFKPEEGYYAGLIAKQLDIEIHYDKWDDKPVDPQWETRSFRTAEPCTNGWDVISNRIYWQQAGLKSRVFLRGEGPDNTLLLEWRPYLAHLLQRRLYGRLLKAIGSTLVVQRRPPFWGRVSKMIRKSGGSSEAQDAFPAWLNPDFESRLQLRARWQEIRETASPSSHPVRPRGYASLSLPLWQLMFEGADPGNTGACFEMRYPFVDLRMLQFLLAIPPLPWCRSKYLLRQAMRGILPEPVLRRKKEGLPGDRLAKRLAGYGLKPFRAVPEVLPYIDIAQVSDSPHPDPWVLGGQLRVRCLNHWLQYSLRRLHNAEM